MSSSHIKFIEPLEQMETALVRFSAEAKEILEQAKGEIQRIQQEFERCEQYWKKEVRNREIQLQEAKVALANCFRSSNDDCVTARKRVKYVEDELRKAQEELKAVEVWKDRIEKAAQNYERQALRLNPEQAKNVAQSLKVTLLKNYSTTTQSVDIHVSSIALSNNKLRKNNLERPTAFRLSTKKVMKANFPEYHDLRKNKPALKKGFDRRHIISSNELKTEWIEKVLERTTLKEAKEKLTSHGQEVKMPLNKQVIQESTKKFFTKAFNDPDNLWVGSKNENVSNPLCL
jgi:hypothetical protein